jgi:hypothetical protein
VSLGAFSREGVQEDQQKLRGALSERINMRHDKHCGKAAVGRLGDGGASLTARSSTGVPCGNADWHDTGCHRTSSLSLLC